jgi:ferredoxin-NADP reductase
MPPLRTGTVVAWRQLSPLLATFRLGPESGARFPSYEPGQYIALRRESCRLTRRVAGPDGRPRYVPDLDERGRQKRGPVSHAYSIASAPGRTESTGELEFLVVLEVADALGRFTEALFESEEREGDALGYFDRMAGDFTLARRAAGFPHVLMVATGTGLAPFASMVRQLDHDASVGLPVPWSVTLVFGNRSPRELAFHDELSAIADGRRFDFAYLPTVSRPDDGGSPEPALGRGRATNVLRHLLGLPMAEEEWLEEARRQSLDTRQAAAALDAAVRPRLPAEADPDSLRARLDPARTVVLTCGNPVVMEDVRRVAERASMRFEREEW